VSGFNKLLEEEKPGRKETGDLKKKLQQDRLARQKMVILTSDFSFIKPLADRD
jgi:hypothetical protein